MSQDLAETPTSSEGLRDEPEWLGVVISQIKNCLNDRVTVGDLAETANISVFHFIRRFRSAIGVTPARYIHLMRLNAAFGLLRETNLSLAEIAYASGFSSQSHMTSSFRKNMDTPPGELRRMLCSRRRSTNFVDFKVGAHRTRNFIEPQIFRHCGAI